MQYEVAVSCRDLADKDFFSKSDPVLVLLRLLPNAKKFEELGRTEIIKNCLNPQFVQKFRIDVDENGDDLLRVAVIDIDDFEHTELLDDQEFIGRAEFTTSALINESPLTVELNDHSGFVILKSVPFEAELDGQLELEFINCNFDFGSHFGFLEIHRADRPMSWQEAAANQQEFTLVHRSSLEPGDSKFAPIQISLFTAIQGDYERLLMLQCWRWRQNGSHKLMGTAMTTLKQLEEMYVYDAKTHLVFADKDGGEKSIKIDFVNVRKG